MRGRLRIDLWALGESLLSVAYCLHGPRLRRQFVQTALSRKGSGLIKDYAAKAIFACN